MLKIEKKNDKAKTKKYGSRSILAFQGELPLIFKSDKIEKRREIFAFGSHRSLRGNDRESAVFTSSSTRVATQIPPKNSLTFPGFSRSF